MTNQKDSAEDIILSVYCYASALGYLLEENSGIVIELHPEELAGKYIVFKKDNDIKIAVYNEKEFNDGDFIQLR